MMIKLFFLPTDGLKSKEEPSGKESREAILFEASKRRRKRGLEE